MPVLVNGRELGVASNGIFTAKNTDPIPGGKLWPEAARAWNDMRAAAIEDGIAPWDFMPAGPDSSARSRTAQDHYWDLFLHHGGEPAAKPYTSNHGWAIAVDVKTKAAAAWIQTNGHRFGFSHDEGARVGEWWHMRYIGGYRPKKPTMPWLSGTERRWVVELDELRGEQRNLKRRRELVAALTRERKHIWHAAQPKSHGGDGHGWHKWNRRQRYLTLLSRTA